MQGGAADMTARLPASLHRIRAVTFDVGGTLIDPWPSVGFHYAAAAVGFSSEALNPEDLTRRFIRAWRSRGQFDYSDASWAALVDATFAGLVREPPSRTFFPALWQRFARAAAWRVHDDAVAALTELARQGIPLAVLSNWDRRLRPLLAELGLAPFFRAILVSCEVGAAKPAAAVFAAASQALGLPPEAILHVGDSQAEDVDGAHSAGFEAVRLQRETAEGPTHPSRPTELPLAQPPVLSSLRSLPALILKS